MELPKEQSSIIKVMGVGGGGSNAVNYMFMKGIVGVDFYLCNTDAQHLERSPVPNKIQLGSNLTEGLGAGGDPEFGKRCAQESINHIEEALKHNTKMLFITAGMGGGTGTGAAPVIAQKAKQMGILTVGIVTRPFKNEGPAKALKAEKGIEDLKPHVDAMLVISNERILQMFSNLRIREALGKADDVLFTAAKGIAEIITVDGFLNVDFRDVKTALESSGRAIMGTGVAIGDDRALSASKLALESPLLDENSIEGAQHILLNISFGKEEPYANEIDVILTYFQNEAGLNANLKHGLTYNENLDKELAITVVATGFDQGLKSAKELHNEAAYSDSSEETEQGVIEIDFGQIDSIKLNVEETPIEPLKPAVKESFEEFVFQGRGQNQIYQENHQRVNPNDLDIPAYKRHKVIFEEPQPGVEISKISLEEDKDSKGIRFKDNGNKYLHDNVD
ncbi:MAG: cell division protein FtsZ [Bacteroidia bacterium]|nr:cell division protein FtsZ [Bacteroidia bacterium]